MLSKRILSPFRVGHVDTSLTKRASCGKICKSIDKFQFSKQENNNVGISNISKYERSGPPNSSQICPKNVMNP